MLHGEMCALHRDSFLAAAALVPKTKPKSRKHHNIDKIQQQTLKETYLSVSPTPVQAVDMHAVQLPLSASHPNPLSCKANCRHLPVQYSPGCSSRRRLYSSSVPHPTQRMTRLTLALSILLSAGGEGSCLAGNKAAEFSRLTAVEHCLLRRPSCVARDQTRTTTRGNRRGGEEILQLP